MSETEAISEEVLVGPALPHCRNQPVEEETIVQPPVDVLNGYPMYPENYIIDNGRCKIFERIGWDDRVGATYLALASVSGFEKELVLRIGNSENAIVKMEAAFLCKVEQENLWPLFSQVHSYFFLDEYSFLALYFRGGPTMKQCLNFAGGRFSHGSAGRLAADVLNIVHAVHSLGFLVRSLNMEQFHFDAASRHLFMADISTLLKDPSKLEGVDKSSLSLNWVGGLELAPISVHLDGDGKNQKVHCRDEYEAWFYLFVSLVKELPWHGSNYADVKWAKIQATTDGSLFTGLPEQYRTLYELITKEDSSVPVSEDDFESMKKLVESIYTDIGGVKDHDDNFDYERDPTEDELPRFVLERKTDDVQEGEEENSGEHETAADPQSGGSQSDDAPSDD